MFTFAFFFGINLCLQIMRFQSHCIVTDVFMVLLSCSSFRKMLFYVNIWSLHVFRLICSSRLCFSSIAQPCMVAIEYTRLHNSHAEFNVGRDFGMSISSYLWTQLICNEELHCCPTSCQLRSGQWVGEDDNAEKTNGKKVWEEQSAPIYQVSSRVLQAEKHAKYKSDFISETS